jgi:hypothetical protein
MRAVLTIGSIVLIVVGSASAAEPTADELIARGLKLRELEKPVEALETFQKAHALAPSPRTLGQMGLVETSLERWVDAETHLLGSLSAPDDAWVRKNHGFLDQALGVTRVHIGELAITGPPGTQVSVDGKAIGALPAISLQRLVEGQAIVTATGPGFKEFTKSVTIAGGARSSLAIVLDPIEARPAVAIAPPVPVVTSRPPPAPAELPRRSWKTWTGGTLAVAGAGLLAWGIVWISVDGNDACGSITGPGCGNVYDTKTPGWILAAAGAAAVTGGVVLLTTGRNSSGSDVAVALTPSSLLLQGRF